MSSTKVTDARRFLECQAERVGSPAFDPAIESGVAGGPKGAGSLQRVVQRGVREEIDRWIELAAQSLAACDTSSTLCKKGEAAE